MKVLHIDTSARSKGSVTRDLSQMVVSRLEENDISQTKKRDLGTGATIPFINEDWLQQKVDALSWSEELIGEVEWADALVIGLPIYNFSVPAVFKAWFDQIAIAQRTFHYVEGWPVGLLKNRPCWIVIASDGVEVSSDYDHAMPWIRTSLNMIGLKDLHFIIADQLLIDETRINQAIATIANSNFCSTEAQNHI
ncbi:FMN-dependent NADH-azoreductase [Kiloniella sp. EL199]|uniref:FMN-dependent NADH-azoreductase n=1 Tax=Kiloniella sp. EL199 TaxID=2107581 RepID=UPI000EA3415D|nr:NAD(P)H-dependent oxidoreductase [Kiloniella sp. EL199]